MTITRATTAILRYVVTHETHVEPPRIVTLDDGEDVPAADTPRRIASAVYERLNMLAHLAPDSVERALLLPEHLTGQTELALRLIAADVEQLIREQLITGIAIAFAASPTTATGTNARDLHYLATFRVRQPLAAPSSSGPTPATDADADALFARFDPAPFASLHGEPALLVAWSPAMPPAVRALAIAFPRYQFTWAPQLTILLDEQSEAANSSARAADVWAVCRLDATTAPA
ncbi:MAG TPA: hypothetical protein VLJ14_14825 [Ktedonobacterales bacterium]|nr:hypothetical protein [Ktedonobacterales bacterium]